MSSNEYGPSGVTATSPLIQHAVDVGNSDCIRLPKNTNAQRIAIFAVGIFILGAIAVGIVLITRTFKKHPQFGNPPNSTSEICNQVPIAGRPYLPTHHTLSQLESEEKIFVDHLCSGGRILNATVIEPAITGLTNVQEWIVGNATQFISGHIYDPNNPGAHNGIPIRAYHLIKGATIDLYEDSQNRWQGFEGFWIPGWCGVYPSQISLTTMRRGAFYALQRLCDSRKTLFPIFNGVVNVTCQVIPRIDGPIYYLANAIYVWPK